MRIRVIDVETTSLDDDAKPVELGWCDVFEDDGGKWDIGVPGSTLVNPCVPISPEASAVHHIIDSDLEGAPSLIDAWNVMDDMPLDAFAAHNAAFERRVLGDIVGTLPWICTLKTAYRLWPNEPSHKNQALRYSRKPEGLVRGFAEPGHRAGPDAYVTAFHLRDLLEAHPEIPDLIQWSGEPALQTICHIGKQRGMRWRDVDIGFLYWLLDKDFDEDVLFTARFEIDRREKEARESVPEAERVE